MNITEMHLAIQQGVDKINSLQADMLLSEEIDIELNKSQSRFINTKYGKNNKYQKGFEESQKRIDDLRSLVREFSAPVTYKEQLSTRHWIDTFRLPSDYLYLVNQYSKLWIDDCNNIDWNLVYPDPTNYFTLGLSLFVCNNNTGFVDSIVMYESAADALAGNTTGTAILWNNPGTFNYPADIQAVQAHILANVGGGFTVYWEQFGDLFHPGEFIVVVDTAIHTWYNWDASLGDVTTMVGLDPTGVHETNAISMYTDTAFDSRRVPQTSSDRLTVVNKFIQQDDIFTLLDDPFNTTKYTSPLTTIRGSFIDIYTSAIFIIDTIKITYIRKPQRISLSLGTGCELPDHTHQEIVDMTVSSILEGISDPRYKSHQLEVSKNE